MTSTSSLWPWFWRFWVLHGLCAAAGLGLDSVRCILFDQWWDSWCLMTLLTLVYGWVVVLWHRWGSSNKAWVLPLPWIHLLLNLTAILIARWLGVLDTKVGALVKQEVNPRQRKDPSLVGGSPTMPQNDNPSV
ncbi:MAG: hypothetical protein ACKO17_02555, partial [Bacteroidota bacterium]